MGIPLGDSAEERWDKLAKALGVLAVLFALLGVRAIFVGSALREILGTFGPAAVLGLLWFVAASRRAALERGDDSGGWTRIATIVLVLFALVAVSITTGTGTGDNRARSSDSSAFDPSGSDPGDTRLPDDVELETVETTIDTASGPVTTPTLQRVHRRDEDCARWREIPHPTEPAKTVRFCDEWKPAPARGDAPRE